MNKKRIKITIDIDLDSEDAKRWKTPEKYLDQLTGEFLSHVARRFFADKNYKDNFRGHPFSVSCRKTRETK